MLNNFNVPGEGINDVTITGYTSITNVNSDIKRCTSQLLVNTDYSFQHTHDFNPASPVSKSDYGTMLSTNILKQGVGDVLLRVRLQSSKINTING